MRTKLEVHLKSPKYPHVPLGVSGLDGLWVTKSEDVVLTVRAIVSNISKLCDPDPPTSQTDRRHAISIPRFAV